MSRALTEAARLGIAGLERSSYIDNVKSGNEEVAASRALKKQEAWVLCIH
jgi:hypothetical protein